MERASSLPRGRCDAREFQMSNEHFDVLALDEDEEMEKQCDSAQSPEHSSQGEGGGEDDLAEMQDGAHLEAAVDDQGQAAERGRES